MAETQNKTLQSPEAPPEELLAAELNADPVALASNEILIDPDRDTFSQLKGEADHAGRPDMVGLEWEEGGLRYRVSSYEQLTHERHEGKKTGLPGLVMRGQIEGGPAIERKTSYVSKHETVEHRTIDVLNADGDLVDILSFTGSESRPIRREYKFEGVWQKRFEKLTRAPQHEPIDRFADFFMVNSRSNPNAEGATIHKKPRQITNVHWTESATSGSGNPEGSPGQSRGHNSIRVPLVDSEVSFSEIANQQTDLALENWQWLTWTDHENHKKQISRDVVVIKKDRYSREYPVRMFEVKTYREDGAAIHSQLYTSVQLQQHFIDRDKFYKDTAPELGLHWELPQSKKNAEHEQLALFDSRGNPTQADSSKVLSRAQADYFRAKYIEERRLLHKDILEGRASLSPGEPLNIAPDDEDELALSADNFVKEFNDYLAERANPKTRISLDEAFGLLSYPELASRNDKGNAAIKASIEHLKKNPDMHKYAKALKSTLAEIGVSRFYEIVNELHDSYVTDLRRFGVAVPREEKYSFSWIIGDLIGERVLNKSNPFEDSPESREIRSRLICRRLGERFRKVAINESKVPNPNAEDGESEEKFIKVYTLNPAVDGKLRALTYKEDIEALLKKRKTSLDPKPTPSEDTAVGYRIRRSFGRS